MTKRAVRYFTDAAVHETIGGPVLIGYLSPGMVLTDFLLEPLSKNRNAEKTKRIYNILADKVETVAPFLAKAVLKNKKHGRRIAWLTTGKIIGRFIRTIFFKRKII